MTEPIFPQPKQVILVRLDLNMRTGKIGAQVAHASMAVLLNRMTVGENRALDVPVGSALEKWLDADRLFLDIRGVSGEAELLEYHRRLVEGGHPCALIRDSGLTEFHGVQTYTTVGVMPCFPSAIDPLIGALTASL
jgi:PTH2 family peptidyl-tRNA hydrolase